MKTIAFGGVQRKKMKMKMKLVVVIAALTCLLDCVNSSPNVDEYRETRKQHVKNILSEHAADNCYHSWIGDKKCDKVCDNKENNFDGGDCLPRFQQIHSTEKMLTDFGEKIDASEKTEIERLIEDAKAAISGDDAAQIKSTMEALQQGSMKLGEAMYKAQQEEGQAAPGADNPGEGSPGQGSETDAEVVDADFEEVDDKDDKKSA